MNILEASPIFSGLSKDELRRMAFMFKVVNLFISLSEHLHLQARVASKYCTIFSQGDPASAIYFLCNGQVTQVCESRIIRRQSSRLTGPNTTAGTKRLDQSTLDTSGKTHDQSRNLVLFQDMSAASGPTSNSNAIRQSRQKQKQKLLASPAANDSVDAPAASATAEEVDGNTASSVKTNRDMLKGKSMLSSVNYQQVSVILNGNIFGYAGQEALYLQGKDKDKKKMFETTTAVVSSTSCQVQNSNLAMVLYSCVLQYLVLDRKYFDSVDRVSLRILREAIGASTSWRRRIESRTTAAADVNPETDRLHSRYSEHSTFSPSTQICS
jgi:hypothetical protein